MNKCNRIAIDVAKNVFQVCVLSHSNKVVETQRLPRAKLPGYVARQPRSRIILEACYSAHYWGREFERLGHQVELIPPQFVKPFLRGNKNDFNDALAIAEAADRPHITRVPVKTIEQQDILSIHRIRDRIVRQRTQLINQMRGLLSEYGIITPQGHHNFRRLLVELSDDSDSRLTPIMKQQASRCLAEYRDLSSRITEANKQLGMLANHNPICQILMSLPGIGVINATALMASIGNGSAFRNPRELSVWLGLTPRQHGSGEKSVSLGITKRGNRYLRRQLIHGARAAVSRSGTRTDDLSRWANRLVARRGINKACVAFANRLARLAWVLLQKQETYHPQYTQ